MHRPLTVSLAGLAMIAASPAAYAQQDDRAMEAVQSELSAMRAAMDAMSLEAPSSGAGGGLPLSHHRESQGLKERSGCGGE